MKLLDLPTIDFTSRPDRVCDVKVEPGLSTSDHNLVSFRIRGSPGKLPRCVREIFQYHKTDLVHFQTLLAAVPWGVIDYNDINDAWDTFSDFFLNCVKECVPVRKGSKRATSPGSPRNFIGSSLRSEGCLNELV